MKKLAAAIQSIFGSERTTPTTTTQMRMGAETGQIQGLRLVKRIPFFGSKSFAEQYRLLLWTLAPLAVVTVGTVSLASVMSSYNAQRIEKSTQLQMLTQRVARLASQVGTGDVDAVEALARSRETIAQNLSDLRNGRLGLKAASGDASDVLAEYEKRWRVSERNVDSLLENAETLSNLNSNLLFLKDSSAAAKELLDKIRVIDIQSGTNTTNLALADALNTSLTETNRMADTVISSVNVPDEAIPTLQRNATVLARTLDILTKGDSDLGISAASSSGITERLSNLRSLMTAFTNTNSLLIVQINKAKDSKAAGAQLVTDAEEDLKIAQKLTESFSDDKGLISFTYVLAILFAALSFAIGIFWTWLKLQETRLNAAQIDESVMNLMTDMMEISDGNLTVRARVAENITGSIADSLNLTVSRLNSTIGNVKDSSQLVRQGATKITDEASLILQAVRAQAEKIQGASASVNSIADSVQAVAFAAEQSADVANDQLRATTEGREAVNNAIKAMDSIREQIQDTSKRIKRLGESAQEIDEIIELISDTTEQTNVLAMNASIQAAAAGEAGRGFRAVATEVQRLAERSDASLKRIVTIIRSIQTDTNNAISAMERSTQQVVDGAQVTNEAGMSLEKIGAVSEELSQLIQAISEATAQQRDEATLISNTMGEILSIADNTAKGVEQTTVGITDISELASELDESMNQFKLA